MVLPAAAVATGLLAGVIYLFIGLAVLCDDFLVPNIEFICSHFSIPDEVAGATLLALGAAAPELAIMTVATAYGTPDVGSDVLLTSSMIAFGAIPALCILSVRRTLKLQVYPLLRDTTFYVVGLVTLITLLKRGDGVMSWQDNLILIAVYATYLVVLAAFSKFSFEEEEETRRESLLEHDALAGVNKIVRVEDGQEVQPKPGHVRRRSRSSSLELHRKASASSEEEETCSGKVYEILAKPYSAIFKLVTYPLPEEGSEEDAPVSRVWISTLMSLFALAVLSKFSYDAVEALVELLALEKSALGSTLLAIGSQVPDTIGAIAMTKADMADGAISSAIGSQVMQMTFGVGGPWLVYNLYHGDLDLQNGGGLEKLRMLLPMTGVTVLCYFFCVIFPGLLAYPSHVSAFKVPAGKVLLAVFVATLFASIAL